MSLPRFLVPCLNSAGIVELPADESHHASRVLRCEQGSVVLLFDGKGHQAIATIASVSKRCVSATVESVDFAPRDHSSRLHFAVAIPKGDRQRNTVEKLVELGADSLTPLSTYRSVAVVDESNIERLFRYGIEACKQCGRNRLMEIRPSIDFKNMVLHRPDFQAWILHPETSGHKSISIDQAFRLSAGERTNEVLFIVGPEGGFTESEVELALESGAKLLSLGERIQRVETAVSTAAVLGSFWLSPT